jgi:hypothetical protein
LPHHLFQSDELGFDGHVLAVYYSVIFAHRQIPFDLANEGDIAWLVRHPQALEHLPSAVTLVASRDTRWGPSSIAVQLISLLQGHRATVNFPGPVLDDIVLATKYLQGLSVEEVVLGDCRGLAMEASMEYVVNLFRHTRIGTFTLQKFYANVRGGKRYLRRKLAVLPLVTSLRLIEVDFQTYQASSILRKTRDPHRSFLSAFVNLEKLSVLDASPMSGDFLSHVPLRALRQLELVVSGLTADRLMAALEQCPVLEDLALPSHRLAPEEIIMALSSCPKTLVNVKLILFDGGNEFDPARTGAHEQGFRQLFGQTDRFPSLQSADMLILTNLSSLWGNGIHRMRVGLKGGRRYVDCSVALEASAEEIGTWGFPAGDPLIETAIWNFKPVPVLALPGPTSFLAGLFGAPPANPTHTRSTHPNAPSLGAPSYHSQALPGPPPLPTSQAPSCTLSTKSELANFSLVPLATSLSGLLLLGIPLLLMWSFVALVAEWC